MWARFIWYEPNFHRPTTYEHFSVIKFSTRIHLVHFYSLSVSLSLVSVNQNNDKNPFIRLMWAQQSNQMSLEFVSLYVCAFFSRSVRFHLSLVSDSVWSEKRAPYEYFIFVLSGHAFSIDEIILVFFSFSVLLLLLVLICCGSCCCHIWQTRAYDDHDFL